MRLQQIAVVLAGAAACLAVPLAYGSPAAAEVAAVVARPASPASGWRTAVEVPGLGMLNTGGDASVSSVSCASSGNCAAGGFYTDTAADFYAFVVSEKNGTWGKATQVQGQAPLTADLPAQVESVSCAKPGDCVAGGFYGGGSGSTEAFVVSETNGAWGKAIEVPGSAALNVGKQAEVESISCAAPGNCLAGGYYTDVLGGSQAFVVTEKSGAWGNAIEVPGSAALNKDEDAEVESVSCAAPGNCSAGGDYADAGGQAFVVTEKNGIWGKAIEVPGLAALNKGGLADVESVSCGKAGSCAAGGYYASHYVSATATYQEQAFVASETNGVWAKAIEVPGSAALNKGEGAAVVSVSCAQAGTCAAGGYYASSHSSTSTTYKYQAFVLGETNGVWGKAIVVPGSAALNKAGDAEVDAVSCAGAGNCVAGGFYASAFVKNFGFKEQAFVVSSTNSAWGKAIEVPGSAALNKGGIAEVDSVSCARAGSCAAGGSYFDTSFHYQAFVVSQR